MGYEHNIVLEGALCGPVLRPSQTDRVPQDPVPDVEPVHSGTDFDDLTRDVPADHGWEGQPRQDQPIG